MNVQTCDPDRLDAFVRAELSARQERELTAHLDQCASCGEELERRVAAADQWREASELLPQHRPGVQQAAGSGADSSGIAGFEPTHYTHHVEQVVGMLAPTDDPEMLGRIGGYEVSGVIGYGGMGVVFKAHDRSLDRVVAIKVMAPHLAGSGAARKRFARESKAAAAVLHPNVIAIHSVADDPKLPYLVMPYVGGVSLQKRIEADGPLCVQDTLRIAQQIAAGLAAAHAQGLVHRDIKPANILLERGVERVTITDFGLARAVDDATMTRSGVIAGTPQYMSPEQARGAGVDHRSDLFSLGSVMYMMCTGHSPFRAETTFGILRRITDNEPRPIREINPDVPEWLCLIIEKLLAKDADARFQRAEEVAELLEGCLAHVQQPTTVPLPKNCPSISENGKPDKRRDSSFLVRKPSDKAMRLIAGAAFALTLVFAGILIVLELNKGELTIECEADDVPIRVMQGDKVVERLTVTRTGASVRIAAGQYIVHIDGQTNGITVEKGTVTLQRGGREIVRIVKQDHAPAVGETANSVRDGVGEEERVPGTVDSSDQKEVSGTDTDEITVDLYGGSDVLPQMNSSTPSPAGRRHSKLLLALNAIEGVTTNFREAGPGDAITMVIVRDPSQQCRRESVRTGKPSNLQTAINSAIEAAGIQNIRWEGGLEGIAVSEEQNRRSGEPEFIPLGCLPDGGNKYSWAYGISADGRVVVGNSRNSRTGFRWTRATGMTAIPKAEFAPKGTGDPVQGVHHFAQCASRDGSAVAGFFNYTSRPNEFRTAFLWTARDGIVPLGYLPGGARTLTEEEKSAPFMYLPEDTEALYGTSIAYAISGDGGKVVGVSDSAEGSQAFLWTKKTGMRALGELPGGAVSSGAHGISADGRVVVGTSMSDRGFEAVRWIDGEGPLPIGDVDGGNFDSHADAVSADGSVIVGSGETDRGYQAFRWTKEDGIISLATPPGTDHSSASAVSSDGSVIVGNIRSHLDKRSHAFVWVDGRGELVSNTSQKIAKQLKGWRLTEATGVSADGRTITGVAVNADEDWEAWIVTLPRSARNRNESRPNENASGAGQEHSRRNQPKSVSISFTGGEERLPLAGLRIKVWPRGMHTSRPPIADVDSANTDSEVKFTLKPGEYQIQLFSKVPLPYVTRSQFFEVTANGEHEQHIEKHLLEACEVVFRAIDVDTGKGIRGVTFTRQNDGAELWGVDPLAPDNIVPANHVTPYVTNEQGVCRCLVDPGFPWAYSVFRDPVGYDVVEYEEVLLKATPAGKLEHTFKFRRVAGSKGAVADVANTSRESLELLELVTRKGPPWVASDYYLESHRGRLFEQRSVTEGVSTYEFAERVAHPEVLFKARLLLPNFSRRASDYVTRNSIHMWISEQELTSVAKGKRLARAFYYRKDAAKPDRSQLAASTLDKGGDQSNWLDETEKLGDLIAVLEVTRGVKRPARKSEASEAEGLQGVWLLDRAQRLQGVWRLDREEQFGEIVSVRDSDREPLRLVVHGTTLRGCFDQPWQPLDWHFEFDRETEPQALYLTAKVGDQQKKLTVRFRFQDDKLELCFDRRHPDRLPVEFRTSEGSNTIVWGLKREPWPKSLTKEPEQ